MTSLKIQVMDFENFQKKTEQKDSRVVQACHIFSYFHNGLFPLHDWSNHLGNDYWIRRLQNALNLEKKVLLLMLSLLLLYLYTFYRQSVL